MERKAQLISPEVTRVERVDPPLRLGVMASGAGSNFEAIASAIDAGTLSASLQVLIYNNPGAKVQERAHQRQIPSVLLDHREFGSREALDHAIVNKLKAHEVECVVMAGWMRVVTPVLIDAFPNAILNIHPSLLPSFKGIRAVEQALDAGVKVSGCTVHKVVTAVDSGEIVMQAVVPILSGDTPETLQQRIHVQEHCIYPQAIALVAQEFRGV